MSVRGTGLIENMLLRMYLSFSDSDDHFKYDVNKNLIHRSMLKFLAKIKLSERVIY